MKISLLTIHKIYNYGSVLQAFALQKYLDNVYGDGTCTIIDYKFANSYHWKIRFKRMSIYRIIRLKLHQIKENSSFGFYRQKRRFRKFWAEQFHLSQEYKSPEEIYKEPPLDFDVFILGSDQVWNTKSVCGDPIFMLSYVPANARCFSYASSFGQEQIDSAYINSFQSNLNKFISLGVRESSGANILRKMGLGNKVKMVCDPTMLLGSSEYDQLAERSLINITGDFILVYCLEYAFSPFPAMRDVIEKAHERYKCEIIFIGSDIKGFEHSKHFKDIGPYEFLYLFSKAKYIISSSFHGTSFSIIYRKPFTTIAPRNKDGRLSDFLKFIGLGHCLVYNDDTSIDLTDKTCYGEVFEKRFADFTEQSKLFLRNNLSR